MLFCSLFLLTLLIRESQFVKSGDKDTTSTATEDVSYTVNEDLYCPTDPKTCSRLKKYRKSKELVCYSSNDCEKAFACCPDSCYKHRICKQKIKVDPQVHPFAVKSGGMLPSNTSTSLPGFELVEGKVKTCPREKSPCAKPQDISKTERFKCVDQCPTHYKCCTDSCFAHKICKKANETTTKIYVQVPKHRRNDSSTTGGTEKPVETQQTPPLTDKQGEQCPAENLICSAPLHENDTKQFDCDVKKCPEGFFCCKDNCFAHKICKEASETNGSDIRASKRREVCPTTEESCLLPADIKHAEFCPPVNCTKGLKCCPDPCFKRDVCKVPDIIIETTIESCPNESNPCDAFLRGVTIHPRFICSVNSHNCPKDTICCSDSCHHTDLCKAPEIHTVVQKLVPTTTYQGQSNKPGQPVNGSQSPASQPVAPQGQPASKPGAPGSPVMVLSNTPTKANPQVAPAGQLVTAAPNTTYKDDLQSPDSVESAESPDDHMLI